MLFQGVCTQKWALILPEYLAPYVYTSVGFGDMPFDYTYSNVALQ